MSQLGNSESGAVRETYSYVPTAVRTMRFANVIFDDLLISSLTGPISGFVRAQDLLLQPHPPPPAATADIAVLLFHYPTLRPSRNYCLGIALCEFWQLHDSKYPAVDTSTSVRRCIKSFTSSTFVRYRLTAELCRRFCSRLDWDQGCLAATNLDIHEGVHDL